ncbi:MAG TPA: hypothetical protein VHG28_05815 [Longimicrobiaceae bacterium]|nr:hypothetical protein [Longimicrobiaceae bacterium]
MSRSARTLIRAALGAAVVAILGFGATEVFAAPAGASEVTRACPLTCEQTAGCRCMGSWCVCD